ncbi:MULTISPECIES: universal stress protein [Haloferax]|uniref:Universal stress protein n=1 Tax=Haloferax marinum TaxID=2666143 RepID=A0A6A8G486_9EURY|nr:MULTISPECIES: universal stress protein [Haloferax]KAB1196507.1 universal stress protein [Haloferax sp. CBA1150]MRW95507.1 universal stress protein [Haloferax marinum]
MYGDILLPVDGSSAGEQALSHAFGLAERYDSTVHVLFVADDTRDSVSVMGGTILETLEEEGNRHVGDIVARAEERGVEAVGDVIRGVPYEAIVDYATDNDIDVIVMATHGRTGVERVLLGSVTERVVRTASVPVLTIHAE